MEGTEPLEEAATIDIAGDPVREGTERGGMDSVVDGGVPIAAYCALNARISGVPDGVEPFVLSGADGRPRIRTGWVGVDMVVGGEVSVY